MMDRRGFLAPSAVTAAFPTELARAEPWGVVDLVVINANVITVDPGMPRAEAPQRWRSSVLGRGGMRSDRR
jgi:hypothetical protein